MGYFNFYKIIKDIIKTIFGRNVWKFIIIIFISFIILFILGGKGVFAVSYVTVSINNTNYIFPDTFNDYKYVMIIYKRGYTYGHQFYASNDVIYYDGYSIRSNGDIYYTTNNSTNFSSKSLLHFIQGSNDAPYSTTFIYTNFDLYQDDSLIHSNDGELLDSNNNVFFENMGIKYPEIANSLEDLQSLNFDVISVNAWNWSNKDFDILFYDNNVTDTTNTDGLYPKRVITLNQDTSYFQSSLSSDPNTNAIYWIPIDEIGLNLYVGGSYVIRFAERVPLNPPVGGSNYSYNYLGEPINFIISSDVSQDKINAINNAIEDMTNQKYHEDTINSLNNLNDSLTNTTLDSSVSSDIDNSLNFDNNNQGLNNLNGGFFSRLTSMLSNLLGYNLGEDTSVSIPLPNTDKTIVLHSIDIYDSVIGTLRLIINAFWTYVFSFYMWKFINKIYIAVSTGNILDGFSSGGEAITNDML